MKFTHSYPISIFIAGSRYEIERLLSMHVANVGMCVAVKDLDFIYTGGQESGVEIQIQNYPRFPSDPNSITCRANELAKMLIEQLYQRTALVVTPDKTYWHENKLPGEAA
jgi:hypothetical protein